MSYDGLRFLKMAATEDPDTWFSVHHKLILSDGRDPIFPGNAHKKVRSALDDATYWARKGHCVYLAQGVYRTTGPQMGKFPRADRTFQNLIGCRSLYIDVDVKQGSYQNQREATAALQKFLAVSGLPKPTIIVGSGNGGFHVYWTLSILFDRSEFTTMANKLVAACDAHGLMIDRQCTNDAQRLLRIPGTWNFKNATPDGEVQATPVVLHYIGTDHIDIETMKQALSEYKPVVAPRVTPQSKLRVVGGTDMHGLPLDELDDMTGGMKGAHRPPRSIDDVVKHCPFLGNTLEAGGANLVGEKQWHLAVALSCHCENSSETVHRLCEKSPYYNRDETEQKLATALRARELRETIGPPKCDVIAIERDECKTCQYRDRGTTPLAVGFSGVNGHPHKAASPIPGTQAIELPQPYYTQSDNLIYMLTPDDGSGSRDATLAFEYELIAGTVMLEKGKPFQFVFDTMQGERQVTKRFDTTIVSDNTSFCKAFAAEGLTINVKPDLPRKFVSSYIQLLQRKDETLITVPPFGWSQDKHGDMGFAFAGEFVSPAGVSACPRPGDGTENYRVMGDTQVWCDLMKLIITPDRPDLACMAAASFAAPLVGMTGQPGLLMGVQSPGSGIGKSTALLAGQSVWSSPVVGGLNDTVIYTFAKAATLRHLPLFYDEIKGERQIKNMVEVAFQLTGGREKGRSDRSGKMRKINEFKTLCGYAANGSIVSGVREEDKGTDASWLRMFEMEGIATPSTAHNYAANVNQLLTELQLNHGGIGKLYATFLGQNHKTINIALTNSQSKFAQALGADPKVERFWIAAIATTMLGATIANSLGVVKFPLAEMGQFMFSEFRRMKQEMAEDPSDYSADNALINTITVFLNEKQPRNMIYLNKTWTQASKPPKGYATILNDRNDTGWGKLDVQISGEPLMLRISDAALSEWCTKTKRPKNILVSQMKKKLAARMSTGMIGSGSRKAGAKENVWVIMATGTILESYLEYAIEHKFLPP